MKNQPNNPSDTKSNNPKGNNRKRFNKPRPPRNFWKSMLTNKAFDLLVVVVGISLAIYINNLYTASNQRSMERFHIENLEADLVKDIEELTKNLNEIRTDYNVVVSYVQEFGKGAVVGDSLASVVVAILSVDHFDGNDNTFFSIVSDNTLTTLEDAAIRRQVSEYYHQYKAIAQFEDMYRKGVSDIHHYFSPNMNYTLKKISNRNVLSTDETKNSLLLAAGQLETGIEVYEEALTLAKALKATLESKK